MSAGSGTPGPRGHTGIGVVPPDERVPVPGPGPAPVLDVAGLAVRIGGTALVQDIAFTVAPGECVALVGPSGSGKSVTARAALGLSAPGAVVAADRLTVAGQDLRRATERDWRRVRGTAVGYVGQEALGALDPLRPVGREVEDALRLHTDLSARERRHRVGEALADVGLDPALATDGRRPGTLSGGMRQRALIAAALVGRPSLIVADEPTTALDAGVAVTVMELLRAAQERGAGVLLITHDMGLVAGWADRVAVVSDGRIVETGSTAAVLESPVHTVTRALVAAAARSRARNAPDARNAPGTRDAPEADVARDGRPGSDAGVGRDPATDVPIGADAAPSLPSGSADATLTATGLCKVFGDRTVVDAVDLAVRQGSTLGVVGASGSGKTTLVRMLLGLEPPSAGTVTLDGSPWAPLPERTRRSRRNRMAAVVQDPGSTFDERWSVERVLADALTGGRARRGSDAVSGAIDAALERVGLSPALRSRSPRSLSGGQRQRLAIARALATEPDVLLLDEPVTALDATVQDAVLTLLERLQRETGTAMVFVSHDLEAVRRVSDDVLVMQDGVVVESGRAATVFARPAHPVTSQLLAAAERLSTGPRAQHSGPYSGPHPAPYSGPHSGPHPGTHPAPR